MAIAADLRYGHRLEQTLLGKAHDISFACSKARPLLKGTARRAADIRSRTIHVLTTLWAGVSLTEPAANPVVHLTGAQ